MTKTFMHAPDTTCLPTLPDGWPISPTTPTSVPNRLSTTWPTTTSRPGRPDRRWRPGARRAGGAQRSWRRVLVTGAMSGAWLGLFGPRNFVSHSELVAHRYDVPSQPYTAERARVLLAALALRDSWPSHPTRPDRPTSTVSASGIGKPRPDNPRTRQTKKERCVTGRRLICVSIGIMSFGPSE